MKTTHYDMPVSIWLQKIRTSILLTTFHRILFPLFLCIGLMACQSDNSGQEEEAGAETQTAVSTAESSTLKSSNTSYPERPPTGGQWVDRPDEMAQFWLQDMDRLDNSARILYSTSPSLEQGQSGDWNVNVYIVNIDKNGAASQQLLYSEPVMEQTHLALRAGREEVLVQRNAEDPAKNDLLEVWSATDGSVRSSIPVPSPEGPQGERWDWSGFQGSTTEGNVFFTTSQRGKNEAGATVGTAAWYTLSPAGDIFGQGAYRRENARLMISGAFAAPDNQIGMVVDITSQDEKGLSTETGPITFEVGGRTVEGVINREKRLLLATTEGEIAWQSSPLERDLMWGGEVAIPQDLPAEEMMEQNNQQMQLMEATEVAYGARRNLLMRSQGATNVALVKPTANGYGALATVVADRRLELPVHGIYFLEFGPDQPLREIYLEPLAEENELSIVDFAAADNGDIYLLARAKRSLKAIAAQVLQMAPDGSIRAAAPLTASGPSNIELAGIIGGNNGAWVIGKGFNNEAGKTQLWVGRVEF